jgi:muramidase (phage lysozyme)
MAFTQDLSPNLAAFLDMLAFSEIGPQLLAVSDDGYNILCGSTPAAPLLFYNYTDHPRILNKKFNSTAAGRYQVLAHWFDAYKGYLHLPDFSPASQDAIAIQQIKESGALPAIAIGDLVYAVSRCAHIWASLPGAGYGQHENSVNALAVAYEAAGGVQAVGATS